MTVVRRIARPLLAAPYIAGGVDTFRHPGPRVEVARPIVAQLASSPLKVPDDPELVVRVAGAATAAAGLLLATGRLPRLSAVVLLATAVPTLRSTHPFWQEKDPELKRTERQQFLKDLGLVGGAFLAAVDTQGRPGVTWRGKAAARSAKRNARGAKRAAKLVAKDARTSARSARKSTVIAAHDATRAARSALPG